MNFRTLRQQIRKARINDVRGAVVRVRPDNINFFEECEKKLLTSKMVGVIIPNTTS